MRPRLPGVGAETRSHSSPLQYLTRSPQCDRPEGREPVRAELLRPERRRRVLDSVERSFQEGRRVLDLDHNLLQTLVTVDLRILLVQTILLVALHLALVPTPAGRAGLRSQGSKSYRYAG